MQKNTASQKLYVYVFTASTNLPATGDAANLTAYVAKDYGAVTALTDTSATEVDATNAKGWYVFDLSQAETNFDTGLFTCKSSTATVVCVCDPAVCFAEPPGFSGLTIALIAAGLLDLAAGVETGLTLRQAMRGLCSAAFGDITGTGGTYKAGANTGTTRLTVTNPTTSTRTVTPGL